MIWVFRVFSVLCFCISLCFNFFGLHYVPARDSPFSKQMSQDSKGKLCTIATYWGVLFCFVSKREIVGRRNRTVNEKGSGLRFSFCTQSSQSFSKKRGFPSHPKQGRLHEKVHEMSEWRTGRRYICERYGYGLHLTHLFLSLHFSFSSFRFGGLTIHCLRQRVKCFF